MDDVQLCIDIAEKLSTGQLSLSDGALAILDFVHRRESAAAQSVRTAFWEDKKHTHVAGTTVGWHIDKCALCEKDLRDPIHFTAA